MFLGIVKFRLLLIGFQFQGVSHKLQMHSSNLIVLLVHHVYLGMVEGMAAQEIQLQLFEKKNIIKLKKIRNI